MHNFKVKMTSFGLLFHHAVERGMLLFSATLISILIANSDFYSYYLDILSSEFILDMDGRLFESILLNITVKDFINDFLMAIFFLVVGMDIKREIVEGHLATWSQRILPIIGAAGGVLVPIFIYTIYNYDSPARLSGWAIPSATDIAFTLGAMTIFKHKIPLSIRVFVTALAIIDDLIAVLVVALCYTSNISHESIIYSLLCGLLLLFFNRIRVKGLGAYLFIGLLLWHFLLHSGIHATIAGIIVSFAIPMEINGDSRSFKSLERLLQPFTSYVVLPLFALANSAFSFKDSGAINMTDSVTLGITFGLFLGKQLGIFSASWLSIKLKIAKLPSGGDFKTFYIASVFCGIGFTMSLFLSLLSFPENKDLLAQAKLGVFCGSLLSFLFGMLMTKMLRLQDTRGAAPQKNTTFIANGALASDNKLVRRNKLA
jgi:NhaA family Na+:H+ antiporter